jgi:hypothetical protein
MPAPISSVQLIDYVKDARARTLDLIQGFSQQLMGPRREGILRLLPTFSR